MAGEGDRDDKPTAVARFGMHFAAVGMGYRLDDR
jgi:hypothetical protein